MSAQQKQIKNVMVVGGGGNLGNIILQALLKVPEFQITVLSRPSSTATIPDHVAVRKAEYTRPDLVAAFKGQDAVVSVVGAAAFASQKDLIDAAIEAGVQRFIPSEFSTNTLPDAVRQLVPVFQPKMEVLNYLKEKEKVGLTWTGISVGVLLDFAQSIGFLGFDTQTKTAQIWDNGTTRFSATLSQDLGDAVVSTLRNPGRTANQYLHVSTIVTSQSDILSTLEATQGTKWTAKHVTSGDQIAEANQLIGKGDFSGMLKLVQASFWANLPGLRQNFEEDEVLANDKVGLKKRSLDQAIGVIFR